VTRLPALESNRGGIRCGPMQPISAGEASLSSREGPDSRGPEVETRGKRQVGDRLAELAGSTVLRRSAYPVAEL
jgi:hypothetical protein